MRWAQRVRRSIGVIVAGSALAVLATRDGRAQREVAVVPLKFRMLAAEDSRPAAPVPVASTAAPTARSLPVGAGRARLADPLTPLYEGLTSLPEIQVLAVRGLGRLERVDLVPRILPLLRATAPTVRAEAANALGQVTRADASLVFDHLRDRLQVETDGMVRGVLARTIGRLTYRTAAEVDAAQAVVLAALDAPAVRPGTVAQPPRLPSPPAVLGVAYGLESLARRMRDVQPLGDAARTRLAWLARYGLDPKGSELPAMAGREEARRVRRLAMSALAPSGSLAQPSVAAAVTDPDAQARRLALPVVARGTQTPQTLDVLERALVDPDPRVRIEALRRRAEAGGRAACRAAKRAIVDPDDHVALAGLDVAGRRCSGDVEGVQLVDEIAVPPEEDLAGPIEWQRPAHALVALAQLMPDRTRARLAPFVSHRLWHLRVYAARAAGHAGATPVLETLARDPNDNVADAALTELVRRVGHRADPLLIAALGRADGQLVRNAARALAGTPRREDATQALLVTLARHTVELRDTSRDVRLALLERLEETGAKRPRIRDELTAYAHDFDPVVAARAAAIVSSWRGTEIAAQPRRLAPPRLPSLERLAALDRATAVVSMARGGSFRIRLFASEAPTNVSRFARLIASGYFNGLTFHRVEPTFVVQGGSPNANEYAGDGPYTRDEVGLRSHLRGTVGISTRGRDTGDGQIFVNLVDNVRLDHNYTIVGEIVDGMDVVDRLLEGDAIRRIVLVSR